MEIREARPEDAAGIVKLLKVSLGESLVKKSEEAWRWKHIDNPFGASIVMLADNGEIIGVRAFMKWRWICGAKILKAVRAVDTATHPDYHRKGIFKNLNQEAIEASKARGYELVYNTPNSLSLSGNLKMGWVEQGRMPLKLKLNLFAYKKFSHKIFFDQDWNNLIDFLPQVINPVKDSALVHTALSPEYIIWRYKNNPLFSYGYLSDFSSYLLLYRIKEYSFGQEMRVVDLFIKKEAFDKVAKKKLNASIREISSSCFFTSVSGRHYIESGGFYPSMGILPVIKKGPTVTLRNLALQEDEFKEVVNTESWGYSIGDIELF